MSYNPHFGNRIILLSVAIIFAIISLFVQWGTIQLTYEDLRGSSETKILRTGESQVDDMLSGMMSSLLAGRIIALTGLTGFLNLGFVVIPFWVGITAVTLALLMTITNLTRLSAVPPGIIWFLLALGLVIALGALVSCATRGSVGIGCLLIIASTIIGASQQKKISA